MRFHNALILATPFVLLAACGRTTPADEMDVAPMDTEVAELEMAEEPLPEVPRDALESVDFAGTYLREGPGGMERLTFDPTDNSYEYAGPDGTVRSGSFTRMEDNRRLAIEDFDGQAAYFSVADGSVFRLADEETSADTITVSAQYRREEASAAQNGGPMATTDSVADKRD